MLFTNTSLLFYGQFWWDYSYFAELRMRLHVSCNLFKFIRFADYLVFRSVHHSWTILLVTHDDQSLVSRSSTVKWFLLKWGFSDIVEDCRSLLLLSAYYDSQCKEFVLFKSASPFTVDSFPAGKRGRKYVIVLELKIRTPRNFNFIKSMESVPLLQKTREAVLSYTYTINHSNCKKNK